MHWGYGKVLSGAGRDKKPRATGRRRVAREAPVVAVIEPLSEFFPTTCTLLCFQSRAAFLCPGSGFGRLTLWHKKARTTNVLDPNYRFLFFAIHFHLFMWDGYRSFFIPKSRF